jgi:hypothetical protein
MHAIYLALILCINTQSSFAENIQINVTSKKDEIALKAIDSNSMGIPLVFSPHPMKNNVAIRINSDHFVEVLNKKTNEWITTFQASELKNASKNEINSLVRQTLFFSDCDQVKTEISFSESTPFANVRFDKKIIGSIKSDGLFHYESGAVCRDQKIALMVSKSNCESFTDNFVANDNPHIYNSKAKLSCKRK